MLLSKEQEPLGKRIYIEVDVLEEPVIGSPIQVRQQVQRWQVVVYEKLSFYYKQFNRQGHTEQVYRLVGKSQDAAMGDHMEGKLRNNNTTLKK